MVEQPPLSRDDYDAIEAAVMETSRGRWFLAEYARRNRTADTRVLMDALERIEATMRQQSVAGDLARLRTDLDDMASGLARTKRDLATSLADAASPGQTASAERAFDEMIRAAEKADGDIFAAAEHVQEIAWSLRENGEADQAATDLERQALELYRASNQHALTTNRVRAIIGVLRFMESRISQMIGSWSDDGEVVDASAAPTYAVESRRTLVEQAPPRIRDDIVFVDTSPSENRREAPRVEPPPPPPPRRPDLPPPAMRPAPPSTDPRARAFAAIDALSTPQKLALFA